MPTPRRFQAECELPPLNAGAALEPRTSPSDLLVARVRGEYREMPGLRLTFAQACRLWQLDTATCEVVIETLLKEKFLARTKDGAFVGLTLDERPAPVEATRRPEAGLPSPYRRPA